MSDAHLAEVTRDRLETIGQLAPGFAHEMNTPLGVVISNLSVLSDYAESLLGVALAAREAVDGLRKGQPSEAIAAVLADALRHIDLDHLLEDVPALTKESTSSADRLASIVRSLALFAGSGDDAFQAVKIEEALDNAITLTWNLFKHRGQPVRASYTSTPQVKANAPELIHLFVCVLRSAAEGSAPSVSTDREGEWVVTRISGVASNIPSVCHTIVARHGGGIQIEPGALTVRLPRAVATASNGELP